MTPKEKAALTRACNKAEEKWGTAHDQMVAVALDPTATVEQRQAATVTAETARLIYQEVLQRRLFGDTYDSRPSAPVTPIRATATTSPVSPKQEEPP